MAGRWRGDATARTEGRSRRKLALCQDLGSYRVPLPFSETGVARVTFSFATVERI
jgi:hypothetical protein